MSNFEELLRKHGVDLDPEITERIRYNARRICNPAPVQIDFWKKLYRRLAEDTEGIPAPRRIGL